MLVFVSFVLAFLKIYFKENNKYFTKFNRPCYKIRENKSTYPKKLKSITPHPF